MIKTVDSVRHLHEDSQILRKMTYLPVVCDYIAAESQVVNHHVDA